jgi:hypothetical protein
MSMKWIAIGISLCAAAQIALLIWGRHVSTDVLRVLRVVVLVALVGFGFAAAFHENERSQSASSIQTRLDALKVGQVDLKARFDALLAESAKAPNDPALLKSLGARHLELVKEDEALKKDVDEIQRDLNAIKE